MTGVSNTSFAPGISTQTDYLTAGGHRLEYKYLRASSSTRPVVVFLHEGLGSIALWREFPRQVFDSCDCSILLYSRYGYGHSQQLTEARKADFMHDEALITLPELLDKLEVHNPVLFGHSDGASIALIHAGGSQRPVAGLTVMAPHVNVEQVCLSSIRAAAHAFRNTDLPQKLGRYHANAESTFWGWNNIWLDSEFESWSIEAYLPKIECPILAIQGEEDEYGTMRQIELIGQTVRNASLLKVPDCRHSPHRDQPGVVITALQQFLSRLESGCDHDQSNGVRER